MSPKTVFAHDEQAIPILEQGVHDGSSESCYQLGIRLTQARGIDPDPNRVALLYRQAANQGHAAAMYALGACYQHGYGVDRNDDEALHWISEAARHGHPQAWYALGTLHRADGRQEHAVQCFERAVALGNSDALFALGLAYGRGEGVPEDESKMRSLTAQAAEAGHPEAQYWVGNYYRFGEGEYPQDFLRAAHWYQRAAAQDHARAVFSLALQALLGQGIHQNIEQGWDLAEKAACLGDVEAMMCLATMIESGQGPVDDPAVALNWYQRAADKGDPDAQFLAGQRMLEIPDEKRYASDYLEKAARQGHDEAKALLETLAEEPKPVPPDPAQVLEAAVAGDACSQYQLGFGHFMGIVVPKSLSLSYFWFSVLAKTMPAQATQMLRMLDGQLPQDLRDVLDGDVAHWTPGNRPPAVS